MTLGNSEILFASLVGSGIVRNVPKFKMIENEFGKHVLPVVPFPMFQNETLVREKEYDPIPGSYTEDSPIGKENQFFPFSLSINNGASWFTLPYEPMLNINGKNNIITRNVAKWHAEGSGQLIGTIKERWSQDDYNLQITGALFGSIMTGAVEDCFPKADFEKLKQILTHSKEIWVNCPPLEMLGINKIVVTDFSFPFTKGENVQAYDIKALSDSSYNLLINI